MEKCEDVVFGEWVYCGSHLRAHPTGWCTVPNSDKLGIGPMKGTFEQQAMEADEKCRRLGLKLYSDVIKERK